MTHWAEPGVQCVCIDDDFTGCAGFVDGPQIPIRLPMLNELLTVKSVTANGAKILLTFVEIDEHQVATDGHRSVGGTILWNAVCFRPLIKRKTDISIIKAMLNPAGKVVQDA